MTVHAKLPRIARINMHSNANAMSPLQSAEEISGVKGRTEYVMLYSAKANEVGSSGRDGPLYSPVAAINNAWTDLLRPASIIGRLATTPAPFATLPFISSRTKGAFVGERLNIAVSAPGTDIVVLDRLKIATLLVVTNELLNHPQSETVIDRELRAGLVEGADLALLDGAAAVTEERPASVLHGMTTIDGTDAATAEDFDGVINDLFTAVTGANLLTSSFVTTPQIALALSQLRTGGVLAYPGVTTLGGTLAGLPLLTSAHAPADQLALIDGREILLAQDPGVELATSEHAMIDMSSAPAGDTRVSMFQTESTALKAIWRINWQLRRPYAAYATGFAPPTSSFTGSP